MSNLTGPTRTTPTERGPEPSRRTRGSIPPATASTVERTRWDVVVAMAVMIFMFGLDMTVATMALHPIGMDLGIATGTTQWIQLGYLVPAVALVVPAGRWLDGAPLRPALITGVTGFGAGSAIAAAAPELVTLIMGRVVQGASGALLGALLFPTIAAVVRPDQRGRAFGLFATLGPLGSVVGPAVGGLLVDVAGWRSVFVVNVPVVLVALWLVVRAMPRAGRLVAPGREFVVGVLGLGTALVAGFVFLDRVSSGDSGDVLVLAVLVGVGVLAAWSWSRTGAARAVGAAVSDRGVAYPILALLLGTSGSGVVYFLTPHLLVGAQDHSIARVGLTLAAFPAVMAASAPLGGALADRFDAARVAIVGALATLAGGLLLLAMPDGATLADVAWRLAVVGLGAGLFSGPNSAAVMRASRPDTTATVGAVSQTVRSLGFAVGPAAGALTWTVAGGADGFATGMLVMVVLSAGMVAAAIVGATGGDRSVPAAATGERG